MLVVIQMHVVDTGHPPRPCDTIYWQGIIGIKNGGTLASVLNWRK